MSLTSFNFQPLSSENADPPDVCEVMSETFFLLSVASLYTYVSKIGLLTLFGFLSKGLNKVYGEITLKSTCSVHDDSDFHLQLALTLVS